MSTADRIRQYITRFELEEGGTLSCVESPLANNSVGYWGVWYGSKLVLVRVVEGPFEGDEPSIELGFSLDFASYEVAAFCRQFEADVGSWTPIESFFIVIGEVADGTESILQGDRATRYRAFRDCGLLAGGNQ